jgi:hypothetical protein
MIPQGVPQNPQKLRELAAWYREYAERAATPWVSEGRLQTADDLERYAALLEAGAERRRDVSLSASGDRCA